jgi:HTH-type transcriptional regulator / antitoxin HigA
MPRTKARAAQDDYLALINQFPLASIQNDKQLDAAITMLDSLLAREPLKSGEEQYLGALTDLVEHYEEHHVNIESATDGAMLQHLMDSKNATQSDVVKGTGIQKSTISEVLADKRTLSRANVQKVCEFFGVSTRLFADIKR